MTAGRRLVGVLVGLASLAVALVAAGAVGSVRADAGLVHLQTVADGVPLTVIRPAGEAGRLPGAVVVHGFAGSARLMRPFADTLARNGYVVVLPDLAGHGAAVTPMTDPASDLDVAVRTLRARSDVDADRIVLVGHSRGAAAVMSYAAAHPEVAATVALSGAAPVSRPGNLLLLYGQWESPILSAAAYEMLLWGDPTASVTTGHTYGSFADGTARRADPVPGVEHVSILYSPVAHRWTLAWLDAAVRPGAPAGAVHPVDRLWPAALLLLGFLVGFVPLSAALLRVGARDRAMPVAGVGPPTGVDVRRLALATGAGLVPAVVVGGLAPDPALNLAVGGYTAAVLVAFGLGALAGDRLLASDRFRAGDRRAAGRPTGHVRISTVAVIVLLTVYATAMVAVPIHTGLTWVAPSPERVPALVALLVAGWVLFAAAERLGAGRWYLHAAVVAAPLVLLGALAVFGLGPGFLALILPLLAGLLAIGAGIAAVLRRLAVPAWLAGVVAAAPFAWTTATTLPLT